MTETLTPRIIPNNACPELSIHRVSVAQIQAQHYNTWSSFRIIANNENGVTLFDLTLFSESMRDIYVDQFPDWKEPRQQEAVAGTDGGEAPIPEGKLDRKPRGLDSENEIDDEIPF